MAGDRDSRRDGRDREELEGPCHGRDREGLEGWQGTVRSRRDGRGP